MNQKREENPGFLLLAHPDFCVFLVVLVKYRCPHFSDREMVGYKWGFARDPLGPMKLQLSKKRTGGGWI